MTGEATHVVILRNEIPNTDITTLWFGIVRSDDEEQSRVIMAESKNGKRVSSVVFETDEWIKLTDAIRGGVL